MNLQLLRYGLLLPFLFAACNQSQEISSVDPVSWESRRINLPQPDSLQSGTSYLSVYSQIYSQTEHKTHDLTATVSMRNVNLQDSIYLLRASYYNTGGSLIRNYFDFPIYIGPMETVEIVIDETDRDGGTGGNFLFEWKIPGQVAEPLFESVMISTSGQQGLSFTTRGVSVIN